MFYSTGPRLFSTVKASIRAELYSYKTTTCLNIINLTGGYSYLKKGEKIIIMNRFFNTDPILMSMHGHLTKGEGSVQLTS
jgi:hypothetical protein